MSKVKINKLIERYYKQGSEKGRQLIITLKKQKDINIEEVPTAER